MKKSKVIVPAMALLLFSTAASVTSTVAWFTSTRTFTTTVGQFNVVETDGNLECVMKGDPINGGTKTGDQGKSVDVISAQETFYIDDTLEGASLEAPENKKTINPVVLTHGSVNAVTTGDHLGKAFVVDPDNAATYISKAADGDWAYKTGVTIEDSAQTPQTHTVDVYIAVKWTMKFTYHFAADTKPVGVYLDLGASSFGVPDNKVLDFTKNADAKHHLLDSARGFRIGFRGGHNFVWGNNVPMIASDKYDAYAEQAYALGDHVIHDGAAYYCTTAIASGEAWDGAKWTATGEKVLPAEYATTGKAYAANDKVVHDGIIYACNTTIADPAGAWDPAKWDVTGEVTLNTDAASDATYVSSPTVATGTAKHTATDYVTHLAGDELVEEGVEHTNTVVKASRVCVLTSTQPTVTINCAAWFEGTDPNIVSGTALSCLKADMKFYARSLIAD